MKHILVAEDEPHTRFTLDLILRKSGYKVTLAEDGQTSLKVVQNLEGTREAVHLLLTDIQMAGLNGVDLIDRMGKIQPRLPIIVITGYGHEEKIMELKQRRGIKCLDKPFDPEELVACINGALAS